MITHKSTANAIAGKTARACESCLKRRARWFCPADDAFLCQLCDSSVHSANQLAGRHHRVRLDTASFKPEHRSSPPPPAWHRGFTKKARTPRHSSRAKSSHEKQMMPLVPEMSGDDEASVEEERDEHMFFSVPTFEPFEVELDDATLGTSNNNEVNGIGFEDGEFNISLIDDWSNVPEFLPSDNDLAEFAADVENLLEQGEYQIYAGLPLSEKNMVFERPFSEKNMESLDFDEETKMKEGERSGVKVEEETESTTDCGNDFDWSMDVAREILNFEVSYGESQRIDVKEEDEKKVELMTSEIEERIAGSNISMQAKKRRKIFLRLNYDEVINAWSGSSPWTTGRRPEFDPDHDGWPDSMGFVGPQSWEALCWRSGNVDGGDGGREARVSRYREKRRTRLFSKKIRYEVRKLNAEKRPRLKGRFVKRTSLASVPGFEPTFSQSHLNK